MANVSVLDVGLYGKPIGTLTLLPGHRTLFAFDEDYIADPDRPTLSLSFKDQLGGLIADIRPTQNQVPPFFSNLLPEGALREYLAKRAGVHPGRNSSSSGCWAAICRARLRPPPPTATRGPRKRMASSLPNG